jgi:tape measure domain-containing protein
MEGGYKAMSKTIDQRVVEMRFDNANFEKNVSTSMSTLDKLKKSLKFEDSAKGFENISKAAGRVDMGGLSNGVESVRLKFSALEVMAVTALQNITNSALNAGKKLVSDLALDPIISGFKEYETQINATQTILANTQKEGANIDDVNRALDELNKYADLTIYNFTEMTRNIGTFTAAGVDLNTSVNAIKGIANLAAVSGSTSQQASTAMYQLSQALASGTVKLMDWNSVVNAGMGGQVFQDALKMTARIHGIAIDEMIADEGSFRETLSKGWLTSDILTETLQHFTEFTDTYNEESLKRQGYNEKEIAEIKQMGITATDAATKVKTLSQLYDVMKETAQSGWAATWKILLGDFEEAKESLTNFSNMLNEPLAAAADARNKILSEGFSSGWKQFLNEGIEDTEGFKEAVLSIGKEAVPGLEDLIEKAGGFEESLKKGWITSDMLAEAVGTLTAKTAGLSDEELRNLGYTRDQVTALEDLNKRIQDGSVNLDGYAKKMGRVSGRENIILALTAAFEKLQTILGTIKNAFNEVFEPLTGEELYNFTVQIKDFVSGLTMSEETLNNFKMTFKGAFAFVDIIGQGLNALGQILGHLLEKLLPLGDGFLGVTGGIGEWIVSIDEAIKSGDGLTKFVELVNGAIDKLASGFKIAKDHVVEFIQSWTGIGSIKELLVTVSNGIASFFSGIVEHAKSSKGTISAIGDAIKKTVGTIWDALKTAFKWISEKVSLGDIFAGLAGGGIFVAAKKLSDLIEKIKEALEKLFGSDKDGGIKGKFAEVMDSIHDTLSSFADGIKVSSIVAIAVAIGILSASMNTIAKLDVGEILKSLASIGIMLAMLSGTMKSISKTLNGLGSKGLIKASGSLVLVAAAVAIMAGAMKKLADLSLAGIAKSLIALGGGLFILVQGLKSIEKTHISISTSVALIALATSCRILASALQKFSEMSWDEIGRGLIAMAGALAELVASVSILSKYSDGKSLLGALSIIAISLALGKIAKALKKFSEMSWDEIDRGLIGMGYALAELTAVIAILNQVGGGKSLVGAISVIAIVLSLNKLGDALKKFGGMSWNEIARGLTGMGGALLEVSVITGALGYLTGFAGLLGAGTIFIVIQGLVDLADAFKSFGGMSWGEIARGLTGMGGALLEVGAIAGALGVLTGPLGLLGAGTLLLAIQGLSDLADAFKSFGKMPWDEIGRGLVGMGGALAEVSVVAGALGALAGLPALLGSGAILLAVQGLGDLADAFQKFGEMSWDEISRGLSAMGGALGEVALGGILNTLSGLGALSISKIAEPLGTLADSVKKWTGVVIPDGLTLQLAALAAGIYAFTFSGIGALSLSAAAEPLGILADSVKKWTGVVIPDGLTLQLAALAAGIAAFSFSSVGALSLFAAAEPLGILADSVKKWTGVVIPDGLALQLAALAAGIAAFSFAFLGGWSIDAIAEPLGELATSIRKWRSVSIPEDLEDGLKRLADGIQAFSWAFLGGWSLGAIVAPLSDLADSVKKWNGVSIPADLGDELDALADGVKAFNWAFLGGWSLDAITGPLGTLADTVKKWKNVSVPQNLGNDLSRLADGITAFANIPDVSSVASSVNTISTAAIALSKTDFSTLSISVKSLTDSIKALASLDSIDASFAKLGNDIVKELITPIKNAPNQFKAAGTSLIKFFLTGITSQTSTVVAKAKEITTKMTSAISSQKSRFRASGSDLMKEVSSGVSGQTNTVKNQFSTLLSNCIATVRSYYSQFQSAGSYLAAGIANGIAANSGSASSAARSLAGNAARASARRLEEKSPSKVGYKIGDYFGIGFTNGITDNIRNAGISSDALAESATKGLSNAVSKIATLIDSGIDTNPTIRPVLDLTEIQNGSAAMADLMSTLSGRPVEGTVSIAAKTASSMNRPAFAPEQQTEIPNGKQTSENTTNNFYITGTDPRAIADEVDRKLQRRVERKKAAWA